MALSRSFTLDWELPMAHSTMNPGFSTGTAEHRRESHDLTRPFWLIAIPVCLLFWAAVAYGIHSAV
jgi:hypothetical protein